MRKQNDLTPNYRCSLQVMTAWFASRLGACVRRTGVANNPSNRPHYALPLTLDVSPETALRC